MQHLALGPAQQEGAHQPAQPLAGDVVLLALDRARETLGELGQILRLTGRKPVLIDPALPCESPFGNGVVIEARTSGLVHLGSGGCIAERANVFAFSFNVENIIDLMDASRAFPSTMTVSGSATL